MKQDMIKKVLDNLKSKGIIDNYNSTSVKTKSYELFFVLQKLETVRKSESESLFATVYKINSESTVGASRFAVYASDSEADIEQKAKEAAKYASLINDAKYTLPSDTEACDEKVDSNLFDLDEKAVGEAVAQAVLNACNKADCNINALEVFVVEDVTTVINGNGVNKRQTKRHIDVEAIPTCNAEQESVELFETYTFGELDVKAIEKEIAARIDDVAARAVAKRPETEINCPVILNPYEIKELVENIAGDANFANEVMHSNLLSEGDSWQSDPKHDKITVTMRSVVKGNAASSYFDGDGTKLKDTVIIKDGKVTAGFGGHRFAEYVGKEPTGNLGIVQLNLGDTPVKDMLAKPHLECVYLSGLQVDLYNDYIGGEIRLAYYFDGEKRVPVTKIAMSGKLSEVLNTVTLSKESASLNGYEGPEKISLEGMKVF